MIQANKGAISFIGSAAPSYWGPDDVLERNFYNSFFSNPLESTPIKDGLFFGLTKVQEFYPGIDPSQQLWLLPQNLFYLPIIFK